MKLFLSIILAAQLLGGYMETKLAEGINLITWQADGYCYAQIEHNGVYGTKRIIKASPDDYISVKAISPSLAKATYSDGSTRLLHISDGCIAVMEEK